MPTITRTTQRAMASCAVAVASLLGTLAPTDQVAHADTYLGWSMPL